MSCEIYNVPKGASAGRNHCVGRVDSDGSVYDVPSGVSAGRNHCVGHIESDGNVYNVPWGVSAGISNCVGHVDSGGNVYRVPKGVSAGISNCVGHVDSSGNVYRTPKGASAGVGSCAGHVEGGNSRQGAAALLLLLNHRAGSSAGGGGKRSFLGNSPGLVVVGVFVVVTLGSLLLSGAFNAELIALGCVALIVAAVAWIVSGAIRKAREGGHTAYTPPKKTDTPPKKTTPPKQTYAFFTCGSCGQKVRVPAGKGRIQIICPKCGNRFNANT